jgi:DNA-binding MarR family transcriptional regulator
MTKAQRGMSVSEAAAPGAGEPLRMDALSALLGFEMRMAQTAMHRDFIAQLKDLDLTQKLTAVLTLLDENPGVSQIALSNALGADKATIMAMIDRLEARALIVRVRSRVDRRRQELYLSPDGAELLTEAKALIQTHEARFKTLFSAGELEQFRSFLRRIYRTG